MRLARIIIVALLLCACGCTSGRLRQRTVNQGSTLPELQYQQVLGNLALFATNPNALPWHVNLREGTTQITDSISGGSLVDLGPPAVTQPQIFGSRTVVAQWGMAPVIDPIELELLRVAYRRASGSGEMPSPEVWEELAHELKDQFALNADLRNESDAFYELEERGSKSFGALDARILTTNDLAFCDGGGRDQSPLARNVCRKLAMIERELAQIQPGWFCVGRKRDVPKDACYSGRYDECYVWVEPAGCEALTRFTLTVLKLSTVIKETQTLISPGSVKFSPGDRGS
ncbi:MAG TPA: hypothetical protein VMF30_18530 [Pirellulales bacterium]|nr:hypothetical protein [Pirellulales bacterium]